MARRAFIHSIQFEYRRDKRPCACRLGRGVSVADLNDRRSRESTKRGWRFLAPTLTGYIISLVFRPKFNHLAKELAIEVVERYATGKEGKVT